MRSGYRLNRHARADGKRHAVLRSDAGLTLLREIERKAGLAQRLADCLSDPRDPAKV